MADISKVERKMKIGVSSCLLGDSVRYDGGHKHDKFITGVLAEYFSLVPFCPETEAGMGVPREPVSLVGDSDSPLMIGINSGTDWTRKVKKVSTRYIKSFKKIDLSGYILKSNSPSCGIKRVEVYSKRTGVFHKKGQGIFAKALIKAFPFLPVEEESRLNNIRLLENFIGKALGYTALQELFSGKYSSSKIVDFHSRQKYLLMAHSLKHCKSLGQLLAAIQEYSPADFKNEYFGQFMTALGMKATIRKNCYVLKHILGDIKNTITAEDRKYLIRLIGDYKNRLIPLIVPLSIIKYYIYKYDIGHISKQSYLSTNSVKMMTGNQ